MSRVEPTEIRYIKLGAGDRWARRSLERGEVPFGYAMVPHEICLQQDWEGIADVLKGEGRPASAIKDDLREIRDFYTLGVDCLWVTFAEGFLWWAFAEREVAWRGGDGGEHGIRIRKTQGGWQNTDAKGRPLRIYDLSSALTRLMAYQRTLCRVGPTAYLLRRINAESDPMVARAEELRGEMVSVAAQMIAGLHWADFETLVDLIFARSGWQRISRVGGGQKDVDLVLEQPATGERACVQVKSQATQSVLDDFADRVCSSGAFDRGFFVCHSLKGRVSIDDDRRLHLWTGNQLAQAAVGAGLFDWLIERAG